jgi:hypothetical protein
MFNKNSNNKQITMKTLTTLLLLTILSYASFGQLEFEKGYLVTKDNQRKDCLIKNEEWKNNPSEFTYKLNETASPTIGDLKTVQEFSITNTCKYVNANVKIDLQTKPEVGAKNEVIPVWTRERLFLKVLLEGKAKLYSYEAGKLKRYFYSLNDTSIIQLTYLEAYVNGNSNLIKNTSYQQQLWSGVKAPMATMNSIKAIGYNEKDLTAYFKEYNSNFGGSTTELTQTKRKSYFNLKLAPGLNSSGVEMNTVVSSQNESSLVKFDNQMNFRMGLEAELILPFNKYHWGILFEPTYQSYSGEAQGKYGLSTIDYQAIEFPIGLRYYFPISENTRIFLNGFVIPGFSIDMSSGISYYYFDANKANIKTVDVESGSSTSLGAGVEYKRFCLETRYYTTRNLLSNHPKEYADYNRFSVVLGYKFMKMKFK